MATVDRGGAVGVAPSEQEQRGRKHVFAVNGASEFLDVVRLLFESESYNVTTTNYVPKTFDLIVTLAPDVVIIDLAYHVRAGWELLERLHADAATSGIPVVVVSTEEAYLETAQASPARYGGQRFIGKPFDIDDMLTAVDELIGEA